MPIAVLLLHEGVDERRCLRLTPLAGVGTVLAEVRHRGAGPLGGRRGDESPLIEVDLGELGRLDALLESARHGKVAFDTVGDRGDPDRRFLRARADPQDASLVVSVVDTREGRSLGGDWSEGRGVVRIPEWEWVQAKAALVASVAGQREQEQERRVIPLRPRSATRAAREAHHAQSAALKRGR